MAKEGDQSCHGAYDLRLKNPEYQNPETFRNVSRIAIVYVVGGLPALRRKARH